MRGRYEPVGELDLNAYADGFLDGDAIRRAEIESHLARDAEAAAYVAEIGRQNREIRAAYLGAVAQPVPDRLTDVLAGSSRNRGRHLIAASAAALLLGMALGTGWLAGPRTDTDALALEEFARDAAAQHQWSAGGVQPAGAAAAPSSEPLAWLNERIALEIRAPDLRTEGFELITKATVGPSHHRSVQLVYRNDEGELLNLFLRPRWEERSSSINIVRTDDVDVHYWLDGPLAFALTSNERGTDAKRLARAVHEAVQRSRLSDPGPKPILSERSPRLHGSGAGGVGAPTLSGPARHRGSAPPPPQFN